MGDIAAAQTELNEMLDEGVHLEVVDRGEGSFALRVRVDDQGCAECLVPDATLSAIATDALQRQGLAVAAVSVDHAGAAG